MRLGSIWWMANNHTILVRPFDSVRSSPSSGRVEGRASRIRLALGRRWPSELVLCDTCALARRRRLIDPTWPLASAPRSHSPPAAAVPRPLCPRANGHTPQRHRWCSSSSLSASRPPSPLRHGDSQPLPEVRRRSRRQSHGARLPPAAAVGPLAPGGRAHECARHAGTGEADRREHARVGAVPRQDRGGSRTNQGEPCVQTDRQSRAQRQATAAAAQAQGLHCNGPSALNELLSGV